MKLGTLLGKVWGQPLMRHAAVDDPRTILIHKRIILSNPLLLDVYERWYSGFLPAVSETSHLKSLPILEIGCGASYLERLIPEIIKSDVSANPNATLVANGESLPFVDGGLRAILVMAALHHMHEPLNFLREAERCLAPEGRLVLIEPSSSPLHQFMIRMFHPHEYYDGSVAEWKNGTTSRMSDANNALPWIIFERERERFARELLGLKLLSIHRHTFIAYYATGGLSYRPFAPGMALPVIRAVERLCQMMIPSLGTMMTIDVQKQGGIGSA